MGAERAKTARLERAVIAAVAAYALVVQVLIGALGNGAALTHALDGVVAICNTAGTLPAPADPAAPPAPPDLCCTLAAVAGAVMPEPAPAPLPVAVLKLALVAPEPTRPERAAILVARARAPPAAV